MTDAELIKRLAQTMQPFINGFTYDPGTSDLDNEQPITVRCELGDWRKARALLAGIAKAS